MAQPGNEMDEDKFCCSVCLDVLKEPVTLPCGHNYCLACIRGSWDQEESRGASSCPQCRQSFSPRPVLVKNSLLAQLLEELRPSGLHAAPDALCHAGPEDVACDFCSGRKLKAVKSCLTCLASYCQQHLQPHHRVASFKRHQLVAPCGQLQENVCSAHGEAMKMFCRTDRQSICFLCSLDRHRDHDTASAAAERTERQRELEVSSGDIQQRIQAREEDVKLLQQELEAILHSADTAVKTTESISTQFIHYIQNRSSTLKQQIRNQQEAESSRVQKLQRKLEQEIAELKKRQEELKKLWHTEDDIQFLRKFPPPLRFSETRISHPLTKLNLDRLLDSLIIEATLSPSWDIVTEMFSSNFSKVTLTRPKAAPKTRTQFLQHLHKMSLDPETASPSLTVESDNRWAANLSGEKCSCRTPERTGGCPQILSKDSLTGRRYWELEIGGRCSVALLYRDTDNVPVKSGFGSEDQWWSLEVGSFLCTFRHNGALTVITGPPPSILAVDLDHGAGTLSFYNVSKTMTLLHRVETRFTQPLYAGLRLHRGWVELI